MIELSYHTKTITGRGSLHEQDSTRSTCASTVFGILFETRERDGHGDTVQNLPKDAVQVVEAI